MFKRAFLDSLRAKVAQQASVLLHVLVVVVGDVDDEVDDPA